MLLIQTHLNQLRLRGIRPMTIRARLHILTALATHLDPVSLLDADRYALEGFLARDLAPQSRRAYRSHIRGFYQWLLDEDEIQVDPTIKIAVVRVPKALPRPVSEAGLWLALDRADPRMKAWLLLMSFAGLRCCEVAVLRPADLLLTGTSMLYLREVKGGGSDTVPAHQIIVEALLALPTKKRGTLWWDVTPQTVSQLVRAHLRGCGVDATAHQLRHYAATSWYKASGHDLLTTSRLLRHANVQTTQIYAKLDPTRPAEVVGLTTLPPAA